MISEKTLKAPQKTEGLHANNIQHQSGRQKYCGVCPACRMLKSMPVSSPAQVVAAFEKNMGIFAAYKRCVAGFIQQNYGNGFTNKVMARLDRKRAHEENAGHKVAKKKIMRSSAGAVPKERHANSKPARSVSGSPLDYRTRSFMESRMGRSFSDVRIHTDGAADTNARNLNAHAYTLGNDIFFASGKYRPESIEGGKLLAHELVHVAQYGNAQSMHARNANPQRISSPHDPAELQANAVSESVVGGFGMSVPVPSAHGRAQAVYRKSADEDEDPGWLAIKLAEYAKDVPGFTLICFILGKNPITGKPVERNAKTFLKAVFGIIPGGDALFRNLEESGAIDEFYNWLDKEIEKLNISWELIKGLIGKALEIAKELLSAPGTKLQKIKALIYPTYMRIKAFVIAVGKKVMDFIFEAVLKRLGAQRLIAILKKVGDVIGIIVADPRRFLSNLLGALKKGFNQFSSNIWEHLKTGIMRWLFGSIEDVTIPKNVDPKSLFGLFMDIMGFNKAYLRKKVARVIGENNLVLIEKVWGFISTLMSSGIGGLWETIKEHLGNLKDMIIGEIKNWVITEIVKSAVKKLIVMFVPFGAIFTIIETIYRAITFFVDKKDQIMDLVDAIVQSLTSIAVGVIDKAANWIEKTMARTIPIILGFLATWLKLGGISNKIKDTVKKQRERVDKAVDKVIDKTAIKFRGLTGKFLSGKREKPISPDVKKRWDAGIAEIEELKKRSEKNPEDEERIGKDLSAIKSKHGFKRIDYRLVGDEWEITAVMNPRRKLKAKATGKFGLTIKRPITFNWPKYDKAILNRNPFGKTESPPENKPFQKLCNEQSLAIVDKKEVSVVKRGAIVTQLIPVRLTFERGGAVNDYRKNHKILLHKLTKKHKEGIEIHHKWPLFVSGPDEEHNLVPMLVASEHMPWHSKLRKAREKSPQKNNTIRKKLGSDPVGTYYQIPARTNREIERNK